LEKEIRLLRKVDETILNLDALTEEVRLKNCSPTVLRNSHEFMEFLVWHRATSIWAKICNCSQHMTAPASQPPRQSTFPWRCQIKSLWRNYRRRWHRSVGARTRRPNFRAISWSRKQPSYVHCICILIQGLAMCVPFFRHARGGSLSLGGF